MAEMLRNQCRHFRNTDTVMIMDTLVDPVSSEHYIPEYHPNQDTNVPVNVINVSMVSPLGHQCLNWMVHLTVYFCILNHLLII